MGLGNHWQANQKDDRQYRAECILAQCQTMAHVASSGSLRLAANGDDSSRLDLRPVCMCRKRQ